MSFSVRHFAEPPAFRNSLSSTSWTPNPASMSRAFNGSDAWFSCGPGTTECAPLDLEATDVVEDCDGCHSLDPLNGFFGSGGE